MSVFVCVKLATLAVAAPGAIRPPYNVILGWDAASETGFDGSWEPHINPLMGLQAWSWDIANPVTHRVVRASSTPGLTAAFLFDGQDLGDLSPTSPENIPLNPTDYSVSIELWIRPSSLNAGRQVVLSLGGQTDGASFTLEDDILRWQVRDSEVRAGIDTNAPPDSIDDDGREDLLASVKTRLTGTDQFTHVVGTIELGGTNQRLCLYINGVPALPIDDEQTGLFKDETIVQVGSSFVQVAGTQGSNPVTLRADSDPPVPESIFLNDWSGTGAGKLGRQTGDLGGNAGPPGGPLYLNDFQANTFQGEIAILNLYSRALSERQVAVLYDQVVQNTAFSATSHQTAGLVLNYEAQIGILSGGTDWENTTVVKPASANNNTHKAPSDALDWKFGLADNSNLVTNQVSQYPGLTAAFAFTSVSEADDGKLQARRSNESLVDSLPELLGNSIDQGNASFEIWFKPSDLSGQEVLFETGGAIDGVSLRLSDDRLELAVRDGDLPDLPDQEGLARCRAGALDLTDFSQAVGVIDLASHKLRLYLNGDLQAETEFMGEDWAGGDPAGLGSIQGALGGGQDSGFTGFEGQIAILRVYNRVLSEQEILDNLEAVAPGLASNRPPTNIWLTRDSVAENQPAGTTVGRFMASDANSKDTHQFALVNGPGDSDNALFTIEGADLRSTIVFDYEARAQYDIRVRATDPGGLALEKPFVIAVDNLNESDVAAAVLPNIIVYMCDDMGIGEASPYLGKKLGPTAAPISKVLQTPNLERLAELGTLFTDVHTGSSMCSPTRYAILTGRYAWRTYNKHQVIGGWSSQPMIGPGRPTLATLCRQSGYRTAAFGKWHLGWKLMDISGLPVPSNSANSNTWATVRVGTSGGGYVDNILDGPLAHGFDYFFGVSGNFANQTAGAIKAYIENNSIQGIPTWHGSPPQAGQDPNGPGVPDWDQQRMGEHYMNRSLGYIDRHVQQGIQAPFFFYYVPNANHAPCDPATNILVQGQPIPIRDQAKYSDGSDGGLREDMIHENDVAVGLLLDKLASVHDPRTGRPMIRSTLFIFTSDNGPNTVGVGQAGLRDRKTALYEGGHRVPFIVSWPDGGIPGRAVNTANFGQFDLYASLAALFGHRLGPDEAEDSANALRALLNQVPGSRFVRSHSLVSHDDSLGSNDLPNDAALAIREGQMVMLIDGALVNRNQTSGPDQGTASPIKLFDLDTDLHQDVSLLSQPARQSLISILAERLLLFNNRGFSRDLALTNHDQLLLTDGGADLRNDRTGAVGYEFTTGDRPIVVHSLGLWDDDARDQPGNEASTLGDGQTAGTPDGLAVAHTIRLFDAASSGEIASVVVSNANSYLVNEFRYVDLPEPIMLDTHRTYALTMDTAVDDGDLFHHFAAFTGVSPSPSGWVRDFLARTAPADGSYPSQPPDGPDGTGQRHSDMFRHRMFVGPNARLAPFLVRPPEVMGRQLVLKFAAGAGILYQLQATDSLTPPDWRPLRSDIQGINGLINLVLDHETTASSQRYFRVVKQD